MFGNEELRIHKEKVCSFFSVKEKERKLIIHLQRNPTEEKLTVEEGSIDWERNQQRTLGSVPVLTKIEG